MASYALDNPDYKPDANIYAFEDNGLVGFDLWQVKVCRRGARKLIDRHDDWGR